MYRNKMVVSSRAALRPCRVRGNTVSVLLYCTVLSCTVLYRRPLWFRLLRSYAAPLGLSREVWGKRFKGTAKARASTLSCPLTVPHSNKNATTSQARQPSPSANQPGSASIDMRPPQHSSAQHSTQRALAQEKQRMNIATIDSNPVSSSSHSKVTVDRIETQEQHNNK